jgi:hypothetical protein
MALKAGSTPLTLATRLPGETRTDRHHEAAAPRHLSRSGLALLTVLNGMGKTGIHAFGAGPKTRKLSPWMPSLKMLSMRSASIDDLFEQRGCRGTRPMRGM